jgi:hypothetical protein
MANNRPIGENSPNLVTLVAAFTNAKLADAEKSFRYSCGIGWTRGDILHFKIILFGKTLQTGI